MSNLLVEKIIFSPDYLSGDVVKVTVENVVKNGLIIENDEETLKIAIVKDILIDDDNFIKEATTTEISVSDVKNGDISIQKIVEETQQPLNIKQIYNAYKELSSMLCNQEHLMADKNGIEEQDDIDKRYDTRMQSFVKLLKTE